MTHKIEASDLVLCAMSYGEIYDRHLELARSGAKLPEWVYHIETNVIPLYRKAIHEPKAYMPLPDAMRAARELSDYYKQHIGAIEKGSFLLEPETGKITRLK